MSTPKNGVKQCVNSGYSYVTMPQSPAACSPGKNLTGAPRVARDIIADLYNNIQHWNDSHIRGAKIVKQIAIIKSDEPKKYSARLEEIVNDLYSVVQSLLTYKQYFENFKSQINALGKLQGVSTPLFITHPINSLVNLVEEVVNAYLKEFEVKEMVLENIAHSKNKDEVMFYAACWTFQSNITNNINLKLEILLVETGHRNIV